MNFLFFIEDCYHETSYADDRNTYAKDAVMVISLLKKLNTNISTDEFIAYLNSPAISKSIFEPWRQGHWGKSFVSRFSILQKSLIQSDWVLN